jgi:hypothetical protein
VNGSSSVTATRGAGVGAARALRATGSGRPWARPAAAWPSSASLSKRSWTATSISSARWSAGVNTIAYFVLVAACLGRGASEARSSSMSGAAASHAAGHADAGRAPSRPPRTSSSQDDGVGRDGLVEASADRRSLPLKKSLIFMSCMLSGPRDPHAREAGRIGVPQHARRQPIVIWYWVTPFVVYALVGGWPPTAPSRGGWCGRASFRSSAKPAHDHRARLGIGRAHRPHREANRAGAYFAAGACFMLGRSSRAAER